MDVEAAIAQLELFLAEARPVPLSASVMVNRAEIDEAVAAIRAALPESIRQSRWVLNERDELLAQASRESEQIVAAGREEQQRMLSETEVVKAAQLEAELIIAQARFEGQRLQQECEDYIDGKLASFEIVLQKTMRSVQNGRESLRGRLASDELSSELPASDLAFDPDRAAQFYDHELG
ncbi:MAG: hypothetical protein ACRDYA_14920 [Egibacteraceae bacterium]